MKKIFKIFLVIFGFTVPLLAEAPADTSELNRKILSVKHEIKEIEKKIRTESDAAKKYRSNTETRIRKKKKELGTVAGTKDSLETVIRRLAGQQQTVQARIRETEFRLKNFNELVREKAVLLKRRILTGIPFEIEKRTAPLDLLARDIDQENIGPEEAFSRLWIILDAEQKFGMSCDAASAELTLPGGQLVQVKMIRAGHQFLAYQGVDSDQYGLIQIQQQGDSLAYTWQHGGLDFETRRLIKNAVQVKEGKRPPQLVTLPVSIRLEKEGNHE